jgi:pimeloyl-ACP methyl ester carboxylesterase
MHTATSKDGTILAYDVFGSGPPLVYITGATCFRTFKPVLDDARKFAECFTVYNYDRRGRGDSGDTPPYAVEREVEDIEAIIDAAGGAAFLYGHSSGAVLALEAALRIGAKLRKVVIYDPPYVHDEAEKTTYGALGHKVSALLASGKKSDAVRVFLTQIGMPRLFVWMLPLFPEWKTMVALAPTLAYDIVLTKDLPPLERVRLITIPTHIVVGENSPSGMAQVATRLAAAIPGATYQQLAGQNHMVSANALLPVLTGFLV